MSSVTLFAHLAGAVPENSAVAAVVFLATGLLQSVLYVAKLATLRAIAVGIGLFSRLSIFVLAANA